MTNWLMVVLILGGLPGTALGAVPETVSVPSVVPPTLQPFLQETPDRIVAVGFGYQRGATSSIRIRTYDVQTGDLLSEDVFELNVIGGEEKGAEPVGDRIFAGAVLLGEAGLSDFPMRVYDAQNGRFLWQGHMNFVDAPSDDPKRRASDRGVHAAVARVRPVSLKEAPGIESRFLVQAIDPASGTPIWQQSFRSTPPTAETVTGEADSNGQAAGSSPRDYEVVVQSYDAESGKLIWTDRLSTRDPVEELATEEVPDRAQVIPPWRVRERNDELWVYGGESTGAVELLRG